MSETLMKIRSARNLTALSRVHLKELQSCFSVVSSALKCHRALWSVCQPPAMFSVSSTQKTSRICARETVARIPTFTYSFYFCRFVDKFWCCGMFHFEELLVGGVGVGWRTRTSLWKWKYSSSKLTEVLLMLKFWWEMLLRTSYQNVTSYFLSKCYFVLFIKMLLPTSYQNVNSYFLSKC